MTSINDVMKTMMEHGAGDPIGFGQVNGYRRVAALGSTAVSAANTDVWRGGILYPFKTTATLMEVVSSSANDTAAGTGAQTVLVQGLDANYNEVQETVIMNGTTAVAMVNTYIAINTCFVTATGSGFTNAGDISIRDTGGGTVRQIIQAGYSFARSSVYTVPAGYTLSEISMFACVNRQAGGGQINYITVSTGQRLSNGTIRLPLEFTISSGGPYRHDAEPGIITTEKNSFFLRITAQSAAVDLTAAWLGKLKKNVM
jgi:hypothetical protein